MLTSCYLVTAAKIGHEPAKIRQCIIPLEKSVVFVSLPLFGIPEAYLCPNIKNRLYG